MVMALLSLLGAILPVLLGIAIVKVQNKNLIATEQALMLEERSRELAESNSAIFGEYESPAYLNEFWKDEGEPDRCDGCRMDDLPVSVFEGMDGFFCKWCAENHYLGEFLDKGVMYVSKDVEVAQIDRAASATSNVILTPENIAFQLFQHGAIDVNQTRDLVNEFRESCEPCEADTFYGDNKAVYHVIKAEKKFREIESQETHNVKMANELMEKALESFKLYSGDKDD